MDLEVDRAYQADQVEPGLDFEWAVTGCDFFGGDRGVVELESDSGTLTLRPLATRSQFLWDIGSAVDHVESVSVKPLTDGGIATETEAGVLRWNVGTHCGCANFRSCACGEAFSY